jgi:hypothetical protein
VKVALDKHDKKTFSNEAWNCLKGHFMQLRQLCSGLATTFPNTTSIESDFSIVKWEKNDSHSSLTSLSLAGIMHVKQFEQIKMIKRQSFAWITVRVCLHVHSIKHILCLVVFSLR